MDLGLARLAAAALALVQTVQLAPPSQGRKQVSCVSFMQQMPWRSSQAALKRERAFKT